MCCIGVAVAQCPIHTGNSLWHEPHRWLPLGGTAAACHGVVPTLKVHGWKGAQEADGAGVWLMGVTGDGYPLPSWRLIPAACSDVITCGRGTCGIFTVCVRVDTVRRCLRRCSCGLCAGALFCCCLAVQRVRALRWAGSASRKRTEMFSRPSRLLCRVQATAALPGAYISQEGAG